MINVPLLNYLDIGGYGMKEIEKIFYNLDILTDTYIDFPETRIIMDKIFESIEKMEILEETGEIQQKKLFDIISDYGEAMEKQGFIYGFRYAAALLTDSIGNI